MCARNRLPAHAAGSSLAFPTASAVSRYTVFLSSTRLARDYVHHVADFVGVPAAQLGDSAFVSGLLIAAASAAGVSAIGLPTMREQRRGGFAASVLHDDCHITVHVFPERELLLLDVLAPRAVDGARALDVFARRLTAREIHRDARERG